METNLPKIRSYGEAEDKIAGAGSRAGDQGTENRISGEAPARKPRRRGEEGEDKSAGMRKIARPTFSIFRRAQRAPRCV